VGRLVKSFSISSIRPIASSFGVICVDGLWGSGKSLLGPIINSFHNVEPFQINYRIEELCHMNYLEKINKESTFKMLIREVDLSFYNSLILRNANFRFKDDSFIAPHLGFLEVLKRLQNPGGFSIYESESFYRRRYSFMSHLLTAFSSPLVEVFRERIKFFVMNRNPIAMLEHWENYLGNFDRLGEFTVAQKIENVRVPFFAKHWEEEYLNVSVLERAVLGIARNLKMQNEYLGKSNKVNYALINFDELVRNPIKVANACSTFLNLNYGNNIKTKKRLKKLLLVKSWRTILTKGNRGVANYYESRDLANSKLKKSISNSSLAEFQHSIDVYFNQ
jgi:hypothetical protein